MKRYFSSFEIVLWGASVLILISSFVLFGGNGVLSLVASVIGVTSLILNAKGNPAGQALMIAFSLMYGVISYSFAYYGEMMTYLGMTMPMAILALISWIRNPYNGNRSEVAVNKLTLREIVFMLLLTLGVTVAFYFILSAFHTTNIIPSTLSVTTSFIAVYLTFRRSPYFALAYAANDVVLIVLWTVAAAKDASYACVAVCFVVFLANDIYGFYNWLKMRLRQSLR